MDRAGTLTENERTLTYYHAPGVRALAADVRTPFGGNLYNLMIRDHFLQFLKVILNSPKSLLFCI